MDYTLIKNSSGDILSIRRSDGASIPTDPKNSDYQRFLKDTDGTIVSEQIIPDPQPQPDRLADIEAALLDLAEAIL